MQSNYSDTQINRVITSKLVSFDEFVDTVNATAHDVKVVLFLSRLLDRIFEYRIKGLTLTKTQACRMIPAEHIETCKKYVDDAERLGFIRFEPDPIDKRKTIIVPTEELIDYVRGKAAAILDEMRQIIS